MSILGVWDLKRETKGLISEGISSTYEKQNILEKVNWALENDARAKIEAESSTPGYVLGSLMSSGCDTARHEKQNRKQRESWVRGTLRRHGKKQGIQMIERIDRSTEEVAKEMKAEGGRPLKVELTDKETDEIRDMLIPMIPLLREKISKELALRKL